MAKEERVMRAELEYVERFERGEAPSLEDLIETYPDMREELAEFVLDYISLETEADAEEPSEESLGAAAAARETVLERVLAEPGSLVEARKASGERLGNLAAAVNVPKDTLRALEKGMIGAGSVPGRLLGRLAVAFSVSHEHLYQLVESAGAQPATVHNRAGKAPEENVRMTFEEALLKSPDLDEGHMREWLPDTLDREG